MNPTVKFIAIMVVFGVGLGLGLQSRAATMDQLFMNDQQANAIYLWMDDSETAVFNGVEFLSAASDWETFVDTDSQLFFHGDTLDPATGRFTLTIDYVSPFSLQWAEVLWTEGDLTIQGSGTLFWDGGWSASSRFTHAGELLSPLPPVVGAVPLPGSLVLMLSALLGVGLFRFNHSGSVPASA